ncbi:MAG: enoyl-[acyl-carrier-protein] reductase FabK [Lachnospiraceae bacterium]|nr:enoyl-[acyl-carrier-protein] reductase FabK [Lachnospiraceae bacterium]
MKTEITEMLGIEYPVIQGGMAWVGTWELASAVSNAGGLGIIGSGGAPATWVRDQIHQMRAHTEKPFGVNIMLMNPEADQIAQLVAREKVPVVTTGAGSPERYIKQWKEAGIKVIPVVASCALAKIMERTGADALVAEGTESGGHIGELTTMTLVPQVVDTVTIPVIAAGGIADGRGMAAAFMLGAKAVQMGTVFIASKEAAVSEDYKQKIVKARDIDSKVTGRKVGHPVRSLRNQMTRHYLKLEEEGASFEELEQLTLGGLRRAVVDGDVKNGSVMAGQVAGLVKEVKSCKDIIMQTCQEAKECMNRRYYLDD